MLGRSVISLRSRLRLLPFLQDVWRAWRRIDPNRLHTAAEFDDESAEGYLVHRVGRDFLEFDVDPVFRGAGGGTASRSSRAFFLAFFAHAP